MYSIGMHNATLCSYFCSSHHGIRSGLIYVLPELRHLQHVPFNITHKHFERRNIVCMVFLFFILS